MIHLVTGFAGYEHIRSEDDGAFNAAFFGNGQFVMESGNQFEASIIDNNTVRILDGDGMMYGRHYRIAHDTYEDVNITTGTAGKNRIDLICATYSKDEVSGVETMYIDVVKGTESASAAAVPVYTNGNILEGAIKNQMPLYRVVIEGVVLKSITPLFTLIPTYKTLAEKYEREFIEACESHLDSLTVFDTVEEINANTQAKQLTGALAFKEHILKTKIDVLRKPLCEIGVDGVTEVNASLHALKLSDKYAILTINYKIISNTCPTDQYGFVSLEKIKSALGLSKLEIDPLSTNVVFKEVHKANHNTGNIDVDTSYMSDTNAGYTGLMFNGTGIGRIHQENGAYGSWSLNVSAYLPGTYGTITVNCATIG